MFDGLIRHILDFRDNFKLITSGREEGGGEGEVINEVTTQYNGNFDLNLYANEDFEL